MLTANKTAMAPGLKEFIVPLGKEKRHTKKLWVQVVSDSDKISSLVKVMKKIKTL